MFKLKNIEIVIWGFGTNGKNLLDIIGKENVKAIIDHNETMRKEGYQGIPIVTFDEYCNKYRECFIVVTPMKYEGILKLLKEKNINNYIVANRCKVDLMVLACLDKFVKLYDLNENEKYFISGMNLFSIFLYQYLESINFKVSIINNPNEKVLIELLESQHVITNSCNEINADENACIIETDDYEINKKIKTLTYRDLNEKIYSEWEEDIKKFKNNLVDKRIFIIALGPSLKVEDLEKIMKNNDITISMNKIFYIFEKTRWRPTYYVLSDGFAIRDYEKEMDAIEDFSDTEKFFSNNYVKFWENNLDKSYHCFRQIQDMKNIGFSEDFSKGVYSGMTVVYACMQLAIYLGVKEIYLLGCDFNYSKNFDSANDHFYSKVEKNFDDFDYDGVAKVYRIARKYAEQVGVKIYNATRGGKLEIFERVDFDSLFNKDNLGGNL